MGPKLVGKKDPSQWDWHVAQLKFQIVPIYFYFVQHLYIKSSYFYSKFPILSIVSLRSYPCFFFFVLYAFGGKLEMPWKFPVYQVPTIINHIKIRRKTIAPALHFMKVIAYITLIFLLNLVEYRLYNSGYESFDTWNKMK